jgi:hypothetical protein
MKQIVIIFMATPDSNSPSRSSFLSRPAQAFWKIRASTHSLSGRQQVGYEEGLSDKVFHRPATRCIQRMPPRRGRGAIWANQKPGLRETDLDQTPLLMSEFGNRPGPCRIRALFGLPLQGYNMRESPFNRRWQANGLPIITHKSGF